MTPEKRPSGLASIDAVGADVKPLATRPDRFRWTNTPGTRWLRVRFDGDWLSLRSKNRIKGAGPLAVQVPATARTHLSEAPTMSVRL